MPKSPAKGLARPLRASRISLRGPNRTGADCSFSSECSSAVRDCRCSFSTAVRSRLIARFDKRPLKRHDRL
jgi:hypothetical protein